jgi:hypothetical protein
MPGEHPPAAGERQVRGAASQRHGLHEPPPLDAGEVDLPIFPRLAPVVPGDVNGAAVRGPGDRDVTDIAFEDPAPDYVHRSVRSGRGAGAAAGTDVPVHHGDFVKRVASIARDRNPQLRSRQLRLRCGVRTVAVARVRGRRSRLGSRVQPRLLRPCAVARPLRISIQSASGTLAGGRVGRTGTKRRTISHFAVVLSRSGGYRKDCPGACRPRWTAPPNQGRTRRRGARRRTAPE